jgi:hypothetical protein
MLSDTGLGDKKPRAAKNRFTLRNGLSKNRHDAHAVTRVSAGQIEPLTNASGTIESGQGCTFGREQRCAVGVQLVVDEMMRQKPDQHVAINGAGYNFPSFLGPLLIL